MSIRVDPNWWQQLFDEIYLLTDARSVCDADITRREVDLICRLLPIDTEHRILDLCGGHGRHSFELCARGFLKCTLLDYSEYLIRHAESRAGEENLQMEFIQADARNTQLPAESFDHVIVMGNSLGYLPDSEADRQIMSEAFRVLRPGGWLMIDVVDGESVRKSFNPVSWHEIGTDVVVCRQREMEGVRVCARELVLSKARGLIRDRTYSIRLYDFDTLAALMMEAGFKGIKARTKFSSKKDDADHGFMNMRILATGQKP